MPPASARKTITFLARSAGVAIAASTKQSVRINSVRLIVIIGLLEVNIFGIAVPRQLRRQLIFRVEQPGIPGVGREQRQWANRHEAPIMLSGATLDISNLVGEWKSLPSMCAGPARV